MRKKLQELFGETVAYPYEAKVVHYLHPDLECIALCRVSTKLLPATVRETAAMPICKNCRNAALNWRALYFGEQFVNSEIDKNEYDKQIAAFGIPKNLASYFLETSWEMRSRHDHRPNEEQEK